MVDIKQKAGGYALKQQQVQRISRNDIPKTIQVFAQMAQLPPHCLHPLGSTLKSNTSGDIDLAVDRLLCDPDILHEIMQSKIGPPNCVRNYGTDVSSYAIPIAGDVLNGCVQVDVMFTNNIEWSEFAYYSDPMNSKYKGAVRTLLLMGIATTLNQPGIDYFQYNSSGELLVRIGRTFDLRHGLRRICQYRPELKKGGYSKRLKTANVGEILQIFPNIQVDSVDSTSTAHPTEVLYQLFNRCVLPVEVQTAEQVIQLILTSFPVNTQNHIFERVAIRARGIADKMLLPPEIIKSNQRTI